MKTIDKLLLQLKKPKEEYPVWVKGDADYDPEQWKPFPGSAWFLIPRESNETA